MDVRVRWRLPTVTQLHFDLIADNLTDSGFEEYPGTPAYGRQLSLALALDWQSNGCGTRSACVAHRGNLKS